MFLFCERLWRKTNASTFSIEFNRHILHLAYIVYVFITKDASVWIIASNGFERDLAATYIYFILFLYPTSCAHRKLFK